MRLGGCLAGGYSNVDEWLRLVRGIGYSASTFPVQPGAARSEIDEYVAAMRENNIVNAEVGAWSNLLERDASAREAALRKNIAALELAEATGARCCVNIAGSMGERWDGPHNSNLSDETFKEVVKNTRAIIDAVKPVKTKYTIEPMPWIFPDSPQSYIRLIEAVERDAFGVHLDVCNMVNSPLRVYNVAGFIDENFALLSDKIVSIHLKDIKLSTKMTVHIDEVQPGEGDFDFPCLFRNAAKLKRDTPMIIEHLPDNGAYARAFTYLRGVILAAGLVEELS